MFFVVAVVTFLALVAELVLLSQIVGWIGAVPTALLLVALSVLGMSLLRRRTSQVVQSTLDRVAAEGRVGGRLVVDRSLLFIAAVCLVVPGFFTAGIGLLLLVPPLRAAVSALVVSRMPRLAAIDLRFGRSFVDVDLADFSDTGQPDSEGSSGPPTSARPELG